MKKNIVDEKERLLKLLSETKANTLDVLYTVYQEFLKNSENPVEFFRIVLEYSEKIGTDDGASEKISELMLERTSKEYAELINSTIRILLKSNKSVDDFYTDLWSSIFAGPLSPSEPEECTVILKILCEDVPVIPYYQAVDLVIMDDEMFSCHLKTILPQLQEAYHMISRQFLQKTELTSQIYRLMQSLSREDASVFLAVIISFIQEFEDRSNQEDQKE